ncbi:unnamed protein product, partial [Heterosigma akashiwo]
MASVKGNPSPSSSLTASTTEYPLKFVILGAPGVGKTQLSRVFVGDAFQHEYTPNAAIEFRTRLLPFRTASVIRAQLWDGPGQSHPEDDWESRSRSNTGGSLSSGGGGGRSKSRKALLPLLLRGAVGGLVVYDITDRESFNAVHRAVMDFKNNCHAEASLVLVGNKADLEAHRAVQVVEAQRCAARHGLDFVEASALARRGVELAVRRAVFSVGACCPRR